MYVAKDAVAKSACLSACLCSACPRVCLRTGIRLRLCLRVCVGRIRRVSCVRAANSWPSARTGRRAHRRRGPRQQAGETSCERSNPIEPARSELWGVHSATGGQGSALVLLPGAAAGADAEARDGDQPLPLDWERKTDGSGRVFYVDHRSRVSQWHHPGPVADENAHGNTAHRAGMSAQASSI